MAPCDHSFYLLHAVQMENLRTGSKTITVFSTMADQSNTAIVGTTLVGTASQHNIKKEMKYE
jgi:hypothetical protein